MKGLLLQNYNLPAGMNADQIPSPPEIRFRIGADGTLSGIKLTEDPPAIRSSTTRASAPPS